MGKRAYFKNLFAQLDALEQKYYIADVMEPPVTKEGRRWAEVLRIAAKSMNDALAAQARANREYREYVELWVHEIKTPISAAQLICENNGCESVLEELEKIEKHVEQALFYARSGAVEKDYAIQALDVKELVGRALKRNAKYLIAHKIKIAHDAVGRVYSDPKWLEFILQQLLDNAVKYGAQTISFTFAHNTLVIKDDGVGIPPKDLPRVFARGFTGENGRNTAKSTGMGLYLCKRLCDQLSLGIAVHSDGGTAVSITFPANPYIVM